MLQENTNAFTGVAPKQVPMRRIDDIIAVAEEQHGISPLGPALLKLDVQGFEIQALKGAHRVLKSVEVVILESSVVEYNAGAPLTAELLGFVDSLGFQVLDVSARRASSRRCRRRDGAHRARRRLRRWVGSLRASPHAHSYMPLSHAHAPCPRRLPACR